MLVKTVLHVMVNGKSSIDFKEVAACKKEIIMELLRLNRATMPCENTGVETPARQSDQGPTGQLGGDQRSASMSIVCSNMIFHVYFYSEYSSRSNSRISFEFHQLDPADSDNRSCSITGEATLRCIKSCVAMILRKRSPASFLLSNAAKIDSSKH